METPQEPVPEEVKRIIKRYSNRKLYDTKDSRYVTLQQIGEMVRRGEDVQIIDNKTKEDKTEVTLALILSEDLKSKPRSVPLGTLRTLIQERGERLLTTLRESPVGKLISGTEEQAEQLAAEAEGAVSEAPAGEPAPGAAEEAVVAEAEVPDPSSEEPSASAAKTKLDELVETTRSTLDQLQASFDERVHKLLPGASPVRDLKQAVADLTQRVEALEAKLDLGQTKAEDD
jgi:polyhydroxyalkanoate synthesis repressor PhaR